VWELCNGLWSPDDLSGLSLGHLGFDKFRAEMFSVHLFHSLGFENLLQESVLQQMSDACMDILSVLHWQEYLFVFAHLFLIVT
jgi:hypothetical protein